MSEWVATNQDAQHTGFVDVWQTPHIARRHILEPGAQLCFGAHEVTAASPCIRVTRLEPVEDDIPPTKETV